MAQNYSYYSLEDVQGSDDWLGAETSCGVGQAGSDRRHWCWLGQTVSGGRCQHGLDQAGSSGRCQKIAVVGRPCCSIMCPSHRLATAVSAKMVMYM